MSVMKVKDNGDWIKISGMSEHTHKADDITDLSSYVNSKSYVVNITNENGSYSIDDSFNWDEMVSAYEDGASVVCICHMSNTSSSYNNMLYYLFDMDKDDNRAYFCNIDANGVVELQIINVNPICLSVNVRSFAVDASLSKSESPADAAAVGDRFADVEVAINDLTQYCENYAEHRENRVTTIDETADDDHYPTAKAVGDRFVELQTEVNANAVTLENEIAIRESFTEIASVSSRSINLNDGVYEYGRFAAAGTEYNGDNPVEGACRSANYIPVEGGRIIAAYYNKGDWNGNAVNLPVLIVQYDVDKNILVQRQELQNYLGYDNSGNYDNTGYFLTLNENTAYIRFTYNRDGIAIGDLSTVQIGIYYKEDAIKEYVPYETPKNVYMIRQDRVKGYEPLEGKTIIYDGDSICEGRITGTASNGGSYAKLIADKTGGHYINQAVGGARLCAHSESHSVVNNLSNLPTNGDLYCFEGGINDYWGNTPIGDVVMDDYVGEVDTGTICGAMETIFRYALSTFVGKPICFVIAHKIQNTGYKANSNGDTFEDYRDAMIKVCEKYSIPYYDAFSESGLNGWNTVQNNAYLTAGGDGTVGDGCHPNEEGYKRYYVPQLLDLFRRIVPDV